MRKSRTPGSVRGVSGNGYPYRDNLVFGKIQDSALTTLLSLLHYLSLAHSLTGETLDNGEKSHVDSRKEIHACRLHSTHLHQWRLISIETLGRYHPRFPQILMSRQCR